MPSPKSGKAGSVLKPVAPEAAVDAANAKGGSTSKPKPPPPPQPQKVSSRPSVLKTKKPTKTPPSTPPPTKKSDKQCGVAEMKVEDEEGAKPRVPSAGGQLQIVPKPVKSFKESSNWFKIVQVSSSTGGDDKVKVSIKSKDKNPVGEMKSLLVKNGAPPQKDKFKGDKEFTIKALDNLEKWPYPAEPARYYIYAHGCDEVIHRVRLDVFPNQNYEVTLDINELMDLITSFSKGVQGFFEYFFYKPESLMTAEELTKSEEQEKDATEEEWGRKSSVEKCKGKLSIKWGWQENDDWRAYYLVEVSASLDPLFSISITPKFSLAKVMMTANGFPPDIAELFADHVADAFVKVEFGFECKITGTYRHKDFPEALPDSPASQHAGSIALEGAGKLGLVLGARVGSDYIVSLVVTGAARTKISIGGELEIVSKGLNLSPKVEVGGIEVEFKLVLKALRKERKSDSVTFQWFESWTLLPRPDQEPWKLPPSRNRESK